MSTMVASTCSRCKGSGRYSFNLQKGTTCFGCNGTGSTMIDPEVEAAKARRRAKGAALRERLTARREVIAAEVQAELQRDFGPFPATAVGQQDLVWACQRAYGKTPGQIVCQRLRAGNPEA